MADGNICIIGPRGSGKTTYLAALAYHQEHSKGGSRKKQFKVYPQNPDSRKLAEKAENILRRASELPPSIIGQEIKTVNNLPFYSFGIEDTTSRSKSSQKLQLTARDYPGEVFEKIADPTLVDPIYQEFINECFTDVMGCLILLTSWEPGIDNFYNRVMKEFIKLMDERDRSNDLKLAVVMSKCERGEIWSGRLDPEIDLFGRHLPKTKATLCEKIPSQNLQFFALSTFGVLGRNDPRPNRIDRMIAGDKEPKSVLREPEQWQPYNLIEPLYWLSKKP